MVVFRHRRRILTLRHQPLAAGRPALAGDPAFRNRGWIFGAGLSDVEIQRYELVPVLIRGDTIGLKLLATLVFG